MFAARPALAGAAILAAVALAGCQSENAPTARSVQAMSPQLVSLITEKGMTPRSPILMRIFKEESKVEVWKKKTDGRYGLLKSYDICRFSGKLGPKIKEGDKQAPEGFYSVTPAQMNPRSNYYLSFNIGYPNAYDRSLGRSGLHVMMHGDCLSAGCYAMTDAQMAEIYALAREAFAGGQQEFQVQALPFRMTAQNMARRRNNTNIAFWKNLKQGSDNFEVTKLEPKVDVCGKKYVFNASAGGLSSFNPSAQCPSYSTSPEVAKAVAAKEKADNIIIAQLSKSEPVAEDYVAQNGRLRRTLDQPIVAVAAAVPVQSSPAAATAALKTAKPVDGPMLASVEPAKKDAAAAKPTGAVAVASASTAAPAFAPAEPKSEPGFFSRMFRSGGDEQPAPAAAAAPSPTAVAARSATPVPAAKPGSRTVAAEQQPVMANAVPPASEQKSGIGSWLGGLFKGGEQAPAAQSAPAATPVSAPAQPAAKPKSRSANAADTKTQKNRSASLPDAFAAPKASNEGRVASAYAAEGE